MPDRETLPDKPTSPSADVAGRISAALSAGVRDLMQKRLSGGLFLVATPIGNLGDITPRALTTLALADSVYCEDTRVSGPMLARFGIKRQLRTYHEYNAVQARDRILDELGQGQSIVLISDAGMPGISDPGFKLTRAAHAAGYDVFVVPGASAVTTAVTASGLATDQFLFAGFLPHKSAARRERIAEVSSTSATLIFYESPHRLASTLQDLDDVLGSRDAAVTRELTKKFEEVRRGTLHELSAWATQTPPRGEIAIVVNGASSTEGDVDDAQIIAALNNIDRSLKPGPAAKAVASALGVPRTRVYDLLQAHKNQP